MVGKILCLITDLDGNKNIYFYYFQILYVGIESLRSQVRCEAPHSKA